MENLIYKSGDLFLTRRSGTLHRAGGHPNEITPQIVGNMKRPDGTYVYPVIYNKYVKNQN